MLGLGVSELAIILFIALIIFGTGRLPQVAGGLGKSIKEFKKAKDEIIDDNNTKLNYL